MSQASVADPPIDTGYRPRDHQRLIHQRLKRFSALVCHRRFGKTVLCVNSLVDAALRCQLPSPRFAYVAPLLGQAKDVAWFYLRRYAMTIPGAVPHESELRVTLPGDRRVRLYGADNPDRLRGLYLDGVVLDEFADMAPRMWAEVIRPTLTDRNGWVIFIGTPKGRNEFHRIYTAAKADPAWYAEMFRASDTKIISQEELDAAAKDMTADQFAQEFECSFDAAIVGAYYGRIITDLEQGKRICSVPWEPRTPVWTAWDLGIGDSTAIWFCQQVGNEVRLIDFVENNGVALSWYAGQVNDRKAKGWALSEHLLPHDAQVRELGSGKTRTETLAELGITGRVLPALPVDDGINAARMLLPRCWFDSGRCAVGLEALRQYRTKFDPRNKVFDKAPLHDWSSHAADAFRYLAMGLKPDRKPVKLDYRNLKVP